MDERKTTENITRFALKPALSVQATPFAINIVINWLEMFLTLNLCEAQLLWPPRLSQLACPRFHHHQTSILSFSSTAVGALRKSEGGN